MTHGRFTKQLLWLLAVLLAFCFASCENEKVPELVLVGEGVPQYTIVRGDNAEPGDVAAAILLKKYLTSCGIDVELTTDWKDNPASAYEFVVGETLRAETDPLLSVDARDMGPLGWYVAAAGSRIYLAGGSPDATVDAVEYFLSTYFGYTGDEAGGVSLSSVAVPGDLLYMAQQYFTYPDMSMNGISLRDFRMVPGEGMASYSIQSIGETVQARFYEDLGIWMEIDRENEGEDPVLYLDKNADVCGDFAFRADENGDLHITVDSEEAFLYGWEHFLDALISIHKGGDGDVLELDASFAYEHKLGEFVTYREFGAVGDGIIDDMAAIAATHEFANAFSVDVKADAGATYYIGSWDETAVIQTDTDWTDAAFIIDDREVPLDKRNTYVFRVAPTTAPFDDASLLSSVAAGQENLGVTFDTPMFIQLTDNSTKRYIRYGMNANEGSDQQDYILVDENGNVDPGTPIMWDYDQFSTIRLTPVDTEPLYITGGTFTTVTAYDIAEPNYYNRGIQISRSNTVVDGLVHYVENENPEKGAPYSGILVPERCANVTIKNCVFTPHKTFYYVKEDGTDFSQGTYDITPSAAVNLTLENCSQSIPITDRSYWGVIGSNFCKNMTIKGCSLSRADAHQGVSHMTILDSEIGVHGLQLIGIGTFRMENTTVMGSNFLYLRGDYGSHWDGELIIRNCIWIPDGGDVINGNRTLIQGDNPETHDFGYECRMPHTITIDGLHVADANAGDNYNDIWLIGNINPAHKDLKSENEILENGYPIRVPETVTVKNFTSDSGKKWSRPPNSFMFRNTEIITD